MPNKEKREKKGRDFALCVKITEKVALNIASEASYIYIFRRQMLMKNAKIGFENLKLAVKQRCQTGPQCLKIT